MLNFFLSLICPFTVLRCLQGGLEHWTAAVVSWNMHFLLHTVLKLEKASKEIGRIYCNLHFSFSQEYTVSVQGQRVQARIRLADVLNFKQKDSSTLQCAPSLDACFSSIVNTMSSQPLLLWELLPFLKIG